MSKFYRHPEWSDCIYWEYDPSNGWEVYNANLDEITSLTKSADKPFVLIFQPLGDIPRGNPLPHMRRLISLSKKEPNVIKTIIIMGTDWFLAKAFVNILNKIMALEPEVKLVFSVEEAYEVYQATMASRQEI